LEEREMKNKWNLVLGCMGLLVVGFIILVLGGYFYSSTANAASQSVVFIREPSNGDRLTAGEPVLVRALARDDNNITRIELWADGQLLDAQDSNTPGGINPFPLLTTWYPQPGAHTLIARAFNGRGETTQVTITVEAMAFADRDVDGVADDVDACPDQPGIAEADGCPDRDADGIPDSTDACPDVAGLPEDGCPSPSESDRDGDGLLDSADACPDVAGTPLADGCPDADSDGVGDSSDACPAEPGGGADGCPEVGGGEVEPEPGPGGGEEPEPLPGEEPPVPGDDDEPEPGPGGGDSGLGADSDIPLEIEAYSFMISTPYERIWCYVRLGDEDPRRYEFETLGSGSWNIADELAGENSVHILHAATQPLEVSMECWGLNPGAEPVNLGEFANTHPMEEWDGREIQAGSSSVSPYYAAYHICTPSCDESALPAPMIMIHTYPPVPPGETPYTLRWRWDGDNAAIDGFGLVVSTMDESSGIDIPNPELRSIYIADYMPACGETVNFQLYAYRDGGAIRSPLSNERSWVGHPCTYDASIIFTTLEVHNPPADEDGLHRPGPIYGNFWAASGSATEMIAFDACWRPAGPFAWARDCEGLKLESGTYSIADIFRWIDTQMASCLGNGCRSNSFSAPSSSAIHIPFEDGGDITFGALIMDCDSGNADDVLFREQFSIRINVEEDLEYLTEPLQLTLNGEHVNVNLFIRLQH